LKYVLYYQPADDVRAKAPLHFAEHQARWEQFQKDGTLLIIGPFANPEEGAMGSPRAAASLHRPGSMVR